MKKNYSEGSNSMYEDYDNLTMKKKAKKKPETMWLRVANCRGKKPVLRDIKKARDIISGLLIELNPSEGKDGLKKCDSILLDILNDNA